MDIYSTFEPWDIFETSQMAMAGKFQMGRIERCPFRGPALKCFEMQEFARGEDQASIGTQGQHECKPANLDLNSSLQLPCKVDKSSPKTFCKTFWLYMQSLEEATARTTLGQLSVGA